MSGIKHGVEKAEGIEARRNDGRIFPSVSVEPLRRWEAWPDGKGMFAVRRIARVGSDIMILTEGLISYTRHNEKLAQEFADRANNGEVTAEYGWPLPDGGDAYFVRSFGTDGGEGRGV